MSTHLLAVVIGIPLAWHLGLAGYAYYDAGRNGMSRRKWGTVALLVPLFGFFAYLFERGERDYDPAEDPYAGGGYNVHESRADESRADESRAEGSHVDESSDGGTTDADEPGRGPRTQEGTEERPPDR